MAASSIVSRIAALASESVQFRQKPTVPECHTSPRKEWPLRSTGNKLKHGCVELVDDDLKSGLIHGPGQTVETPWANSACP